MSLPTSLHGNEYYEHLRDFRDAALVESHRLGRRKNIGRLSFGSAHAHWRTEEGGRASLIDEGVRYNGTTYFKLIPTTLRVYETPGESGTEITTFRMDLDDTGCIDIYRNMVFSGAFREFVKAEFSRRADRKHELSDPTDEQREYLYRELERGASGLYQFTYGTETEE